MRDHARNYGFYSNKELMQYLKDTGYIRSNFIFDIMCSVDRKNFTTNDYTAYRDKPEVVAYEKTISAPCMHAEVLEQMSDNLRHGKCALDIGSGSGYLTICMALALGEKGTVIGIDCIPGFQNMANKIAKTHYPELIENNRVEFIVWDGRRGWPWSGPYDAIHVGVAAAKIPETLIEQLAPGGCLIMPVGLEGEQVLVLLKKSLNGSIQKRELMKVRYGTFIDVDLPWSSKVGNRSMLSLETESKNMLPKPQCNDTTINGSSSKENIEKTIEDRTDQIAESKKLDSISTNLQINLINDSFWKSLEDISSVNKPITTSQSSIIRSTSNHTKDGKTVHEKSAIFEKKIENCQKHKSPDDDTAVKSTPIKTVISGSENPKKSIHEHEDNSDESLDQLKVNESLNTTNELLPNLLKENVENESILKLQCKIPKINESEKNVTTISEKIDIFEKINHNLEVSKLQENITEKIESDFDDSDETHSVDTEIDTQDIHEECKNNDKKLANTQLNQKIHYINKSFSKSLENFSTTNEPVSYLKSSTSIIIASDKNKTQSVRDKIEFFEENFGNYKTPYSRKEVTGKMKITSKESENFVGEHSKILDEKSNNINDVLKKHAENIQVRELYGTNKPLDKTITKSLENLTKIYGPVSTIQPKSSKIFKSDKTESQNAQQMTNTVKENKENSLCNIKKLNCIENDLHQNFGEVCKKMEEQDKSHNLMSSELEIFKDEIRIILNNFLRNEKENSEKSDLREINVNINRIRQIQFLNNNSIDDSEQENNGENLEQTEKIYKNLDDKEHNLKSSESKLELQNLYELVEKLQTQYDKNIEENIVMNEKFQKRIVHCENLEKRLQKLEQRFNLLIEILAKLIKKIKCHEKVLNIHLTVAEKEEVTRVFEKQKREKAEKKLDKITGIISRINEETKVIGTDFLDNTTEDEDAHSLKQSELMPNTHFSNSQSFLPELNLIKNLLYLGKDDPTIENDSALDDRIESTDNEIEMSLLKLILEE